MDVQNRKLKTTLHSGSHWLPARRTVGLALAAAIVALLAYVPAARGQESILLSGDDRARFQYQRSATVHMNANQLSSQAAIPIPAASRWVVEYVSLSASLPANQNILPHIWYRVLDTPTPFLQHSLNASARGSFRNGSVFYWHDSESVRLYAEPSASTLLQGGLVVQAERSSGQGVADVAFTVSGYLAPM